MTLFGQYSQVSWHISSLDLSVYAIVNIHHLSLRQKIVSKATHISKTYPDIGDCRAIYRRVITQLNLVVSVNSQAIAILIDQLHQLSKNAPHPGLSLDIVLPIKHQSVRETSIETPIQAYSLS